MTRPGTTRWALRAGVALVVVGVVILGWLGWEIVGTTWVSHRTQRQVVDQLHRAWSSGQDDVRVPHGPDDALVRADAVVRIPRFGDGYAVPVLEGVSDEVLAAGFGHYPGTAEPGQVGNFALAGHRITHGEPLRDMPDLRPGDRVLVETSNRTYVYVLDTGGDDLDVPFTAGWVTDPRPRNPDGGVQPPDRSPGQRLLTLTTCSELFHTDHRLVAFGHLAAERPRG